MSTNLFIKPKLIINPRMGRRERFWPASRLTKLLKQCQKNYHFEIWLIAGSSDQDYIRQIMGYIGEEKPRIIELLKLDKLVIILKSCGLFIGVDTGTTRLAASLGIPTIVLFGPTQPSGWPTSTSTGKVAIINKKLNCSPCSYQNQFYCQTKQCFADITLKDILEKIEKITGEKQKAGGGTRI